MFLNIIKIFLLHLLTQGKINAFDLLYSPFFVDHTKERFNITNSMYGTGNKLKDIIYMAACRSICSENDTLIVCCTGERLNNLTCMYEEFCGELLEEFNSYLTSLIITCYFGVMIVFMIIVFFVFYFFSKKKSKLGTRQSVINGAIAALVVLFTCLIIPIIIMKIVSWLFFENKSITRLLGGEFKMISSSEIMMSVNTKDKERQKKYQILDHEGHEENPGMLTGKSLKDNFHNSESIENPLACTKKLHMEDASRL